MAYDTEKPFVADAVPTADPAVVRKVRLDCVDNIIERTWRIVLAGGIAAAAGAQSLNHLYALRDRLSREAVGEQMAAALAARMLPPEPTITQAMVDRATNLLERSDVWKFYVEHTGARATCHRALVKEMLKAALVSK